MYTCYDYDVPRTLIDCPNDDTESVTVQVGLCQYAHVRIMSLSFAKNENRGCPNMGNKTLMT